MIETFKSKALKEFFETGKSSKVKPDLQRRVLVRLDRLEQAKELNELNVPGFDFHPLRGYDPTRYSIHINGPWCITFEFKDGNAQAVDLVQYH